MKRLELALIACVLLIDNFGIHSAHVTRRTLAEFGGRVVLNFLPPYCPDTNRIERVCKTCTPTSPATTAANP